MRTSTSASTVMPVDLCIVYTQKYFGVFGNSPMVRPTMASTSTSSTISQCSSWLTGPQRRSEEHTSELQSLMRISYAVFCLKKKKNKTQPATKHQQTKEQNTQTDIQR